MEAEDAFHHASRAPPTFRVINALMRLVHGGEVWGVLQLRQIHLYPA